MKTDYLFRGKPLDDLTREELIVALTQAFDRIAHLEGIPKDYRQMARNTLGLI